MNKQMEQQAKGMEKWALDGFYKLRSHVADDDRQWLECNQDKIMMQPRLKKLLITASNYDPGSKPLDQIMGHLHKALKDS